MRLLFITVIGFYFIACTSKQQNASSFETVHFMLDTVMKTETIISKDRKGQDSLTHLYIPIAIIRVPQTTKVIKWYSLNYAIDGTGILSITTEDNRTYNNIRVPSTAVAACAILLQDSYVRFDTVSHEITSYKSELPEMTQPPLKAF